MVTTVGADPGGSVGSDKPPPNQTYLQTYNTDAFMASLLFTKNQQELGQICISFGRVQPWPELCPRVPLG